MINQSSAIGIGLSHIFGQDMDAAIPPGRSLIQLEGSVTDMLLTETGNYVLQE